MFDPNPNLSQQKHVHFPDFLGQSFDALNLGVVRTQKTVQGYGNYRSWNGREGRFGDGEDESGVRTPPLWPGSPPRKPNHYRCLSPSSKAQAIARGQRELMEMVSKMPESCYELSLRDLVEQPMVEAKQESTAVTEDNYRREKEEMKKTNVKKAQITRTGSIDNGGFLLKMVFPVSFGSKKKKKKNDSNSNSKSKVSPRPSVSDASVKAEDKEWWKKRFSGSSESESGGSSIHSRSTKSSRSSSCSSSSSTASRRHGMGGCCSFIGSRKSNISE
ncbi:hypothetical protein SLEP1_g11397 [Rubroshorea leprosula]|uniref:Uncharacterized protein n=1 Tax=Rubroshorea leprosula TaxID=152421 RepID=A0AAV5IJP9_9ROSI|nr:hypothetical protein SLEP1_g11397 [Rubroshorea leprosula]